MAVGPLIVRLVAAPGVSGGKALALVTEDGEFVGKQQNCIVENGVGQLATITVRFVIDGETIRFASSDN
jgi:hypothetical protein